MKNSLIVPTVTILIIGFTLYNCNSVSRNIIAEDISNNQYINNNVVSDNEIATAQKEIYSDFQKFITEANNKILQNVKNISSLKHISSENNIIINEELYKKVEIMEKSNNDFKTVLDNYVTNGSGNWKIFKNEFDNNLVELDLALNEVNVTAID